MPAPTRPVQDAIIDPAWGQWVHDHEAAPRRFICWRTSNVALGVDGFNPVAFTNKDDPTGLTNASYQFVAPYAGLVLFAGETEVTYATTAAPIVGFCALYYNGSEVRHGSRWSGSGVAGQCLGSSVVSAHPVNAGDIVAFYCYAAGAGVVKTLTGTPASCRFEGVYLTGPA